VTKTKRRNHFFARGRGTFIAAASAPTEFRKRALIAWPNAPGSVTFTIARKTGDDGDDITISRAQAKALRDALTHWLRGTP
jgi:hypothetical protein